MRQKRQRESTAAEEEVRHTSLATNQNVENNEISQAEETCLII